MTVSEFQIISGGQTGADRAALDWAIEYGIAHGGWCPKGRLAEDGRIDARYQLKETPRTEYEERTQWNIRDSDATVVFSIGTELTGGSKQTVAWANQIQKPVLHLARDNGCLNPEVELRQFLAGNRVRVLNVAGPRASQEPEVAEFVKTVLSRVWSQSEVV